MILLCEDIGWVRSADGRSRPFDGQRLAASLHRAAAVAGHHDWFLADAVATAVHEFVCRQCKGQAIGAGELAGMVVGVLGVLGYADIATAYERRRQQAEIRLDQMTTEAGAVSELDFFVRLDQALRAATDEQLAVMKVHGLRACVMRLRGARHWGDGCRRLAEDIVRHVRDRVAQVRPGQAGELRLAVVE